MSPNETSNEHVSDLQRPIMKPKLICLTPVKNEAWVLGLFLKCTSLWADHIIIADQNSTDGSQDIARKYPKVRLIENKTKEFNEPERQKMLIDEARKIEGPRILFALDADELFTANYLHSNDWQKIIHSKPGDVFGFQWANITPTKDKYFLSSFYFPWVMNDDGTEHKNHVRYIHSMRIPYPIEADKGYYHVEDFKVFHLNYLYERRLKSKNRFYQCIEKTRESNSNFVSAYRSHHFQKNTDLLIPEEWLEGYKKQAIAIFNGLNFSETYFWFDLDVIELFKKYGFSKFKYLDVWDKEWMAQMEGFLKIEDPRNLFIKLLHFYLRSSQIFYRSFIIKAIDKVLKSFS